MRMRSALGAAIIVIAISVSACSPTVIMVNKTPELGGGSPLRDISPLKFTVADFVDARAIRNPVQVGYGIVGFNHKVLADRSAKDLARQTAVLELERNGHLVLSPEDTNQANILLAGTIEDLWVGATAQYSGEIRASAKIKIEASFPGHD